MIKKIVLGLVGLCLVLIFFALVAPLFISVDTYKEQIKAKVEAATGRTLTIDGKLSIRFFPIAGITAEKVTLSNPAGFDDKNPFISLESLNIEVAILPLLHKEIVIKNFVLVEPVINLHVDKDGIKSWVFNKQHRKAEAEALPDRPQMANPSPFPANLQLSNFELKNGKIIYINNNSPAIEVNKINASVVLQSSASAAVVDGSAEWNGKELTLKAGIGTLKSLLEEQKMEINAILKSDLFTLTTEGNFERDVFNGKESFKTNSLKDIASWLNPGKSLPTPATLALKMEGDMRCSASYCSLSNGVIALDALLARGDMKVSFGNSKPAIDVNLSTDKLDLNPFLPTQRQSLLDNGLIAEANAEAGEHWSDAPIDLSALNALNVIAGIRAENVLYRKITLGKTLLNVKLQQGVLNADITNAILYHGTATVSINANANLTPAMFDAHLLVKAVEIAPLLKDATNMDGLTGYADIQANLKSNCASMQSLVAVLAGDGQIRLRNGDIKGINMGSMLQNLPGAFDNTDKSSQNTVFTNMSGSFTILNGIITNHDLTMEMQGLNVTGDGTVSLLPYTLNYRLVSKLVQTAGNTTKEGLSVPVIIDGSLDHPAFRPDLKAAVQNALQDPAKLKEQLKNSKNILKEQIKNPKDAINNIKGLLNGLR